MKKFYPFSSAFMVGDTVMTKYDSGCLRSIMIRSNGIKTGEIPEIYKRVGKRQEELYYNELRADKRNLTVQDELVVKRQLTAGVEYSGRMDFKTFREGMEEPIIHETKGTISKNTRRDVIRKGEYNISYLAQLISYMIKERTTFGKLVCGYFEEDDKGELQKMEERTFKVRITDSGRIDVDGEPSGFNVADLLAHQRAGARVIEHNEIGPRPDKWNQKWGGPCTSCAFASVCDRQDQGEFETSAEFLDAARIAGQAAAEAEREEPVPHKIKVKKTKGDKNGSGKESKDYSSSGIGDLNDE